MAAQTTPRSPETAISVERQVTGHENAQRTTSKVTTHAPSVKAIVPASAPTTIATPASQDGAPRHLLQEPQRPRKRTTTPLIGAPRANVGPQRTQRKPTLVAPRVAARHRPQEDRRLPWHLPLFRIPPSGSLKLPPRQRSPTSPSSCQLSPFTSRLSSS